jgi:MFS family permease
MTATASIPTAATGGRSAPGRGRALALGAVATTLMLAGASAPSPFYPLLQERLGLGSIGVAVAFAIYAVALLLALLTVGSISDHLGRRPVVSAGLILLSVSVLLLWTADSAGMLYLARGLQGLASGALVSTTSALVADTVAPGNARRAALINSLAPMAGLALGTLVAGILLQVIPDAAATATFLPLVIAYLVMAAVIWTVPETSPRERGWLRALRPRAAVPVAARGLFGVSIPIILGGWATGGLFLSLGPSIVHSELHVDGQLGPALVVGVLPAAGAVAAFVMRNRRPVVTAVYGAAALAVGTVIMLLALVLGSLPIYVVAVVIAGTGFGTAFMGTVASLIPLAAVHERAELFASLYIVAYLSFGLPAVVAGVLVGVFGLHATVLGYGAVVAVAAGVASIVRARWQVAAA